MTDTIDVICDELPRLAPSTADALSNPSVETVADTFLDLLPRGAAWRKDEVGERDAGSNLARFWTAVATPIAALYARAFKLSLESTAATVDELLPHWEEEFGLPDPCIDRDMTKPERIRHLRARLVAEGGASPSYFVCLARFYGYEITVREFRSFRCGVSRCGDRSSGQIASEAIEFYWAAVINIRSVTWFRTGGSRTGVDRLGDLGGAPGLECILTRYAPAHTRVVFRYITNAYVDASSTEITADSTYYTADRVNTR